MRTIFWCGVAAIGLLFPAQSAAQLVAEKNVGFTVGVSMAWGNKVQRIGLAFNAYLAVENIQANGGFRGYYYWKTLGPGLSGWEYQYNLGGVLAVGGTPRHANEILTPISNQTDKKYSIAYAYQEYIDRIGTSQSSGVIGLNLGQFEVAVENDIFGSLQDHFRTGGVQLAYRLEHTEIAINSTIWHGEAYGDNVHRHRDAPGYPSRFGYFDLSDAQYGKFSHGLASVQIKHVIPGGQVLQANLGVDAEQVRHALQNWLIHDMYYVPDKWVTYPNPHYPMLDPDGEPYLFKPGQQIRPVTPYFNFSTNGGLFY